MKNHLHLSSLLLLTFTLLFSLNACTPAIKGEGAVMSETRNIEPFTELTVDISANVTLVMSDSVQCVITAQKNIADLIELKRKGDKIIIDSKKDFSTDKPIEIVLSTASLRKISLNGSGNIQSLNNIKSDELHLNINGSGNIKISCIVESLESDINGSGNMVLNGKATEHEIEINGSGNLNAYDLSVDDYKINLRGSGDAEITANSNLDARLIGSGNIKYGGTPKLKSEISGSGEISKRN